MNNSHSKCGGESDRLNQQCLAFAVMWRQPAFLLVFNPRLRSGQLLQDLGFLWFVSQRERADTREHFLGWYDEGANLICLILPQKPWLPPYAHF